MRLKSRVAKKFKIHKSRDEKVPVAWEQGKEVPGLPYTQATLVTDTVVDQAIRQYTHWRQPRTEDTVWLCPRLIDEIHFEHAVRENVDFEWGTFGRAVRSKPDVRKCQKVNEPLCVKRAIESQVIFETTEEIETRNEVKKQQAKKVRGAKPMKNSTDDQSFGIDTEMIQLLSYNQMIFDPWLRDPFHLGEVHFRILEAEEETWGEEAELPAVVYEHAVRENVEFEWGTWARAVRFKADVRGKDVKLGKIHKAQINEIISERTQPLSSSIPAPCQALPEVPERVKVTVCRVYSANVTPSAPEIIPKDDNCRMIYKNTKYFCKRCDIYICNGCFSSDCMNHDVQWIGNATFACESIYHKPVVC